MSKKKQISRARLDDWLQAMATAGKRIWAPKKGEHGSDFAPVAMLADIDFLSVQTVQSPKFLLFPRAEELFHYRASGEAVQVEEQIEPMPETVIFGGRPCDASGILALEAIFNWDSIDLPLQRRREKTTIVTFSCSKADSHCFCTSVGGGPGEGRGSDILLTELEGEKFQVEVLTDKGEALIGLEASLFTPLIEPAALELLAEVPVRFQHKPIVEKSYSLFDREAVWTEQSLRCMGCGACAFVCPTCACFDIQDEGGSRRGRRVRGWDSCGFSLFTLHASGHNPRELQSERWRQRLMHKFSYMPERLSVLGCVGCGRCSRACPVDMNLAEHLAALEKELP